MAIIIIIMPLLLSFGAFSFTSVFASAIIGRLPHLIIVAFKNKYFNPAVCLSAFSCRV
jgi:hypothetical protein